MRRPQRLSSRLALSFVTLFIVIFAAVGAVTMYFAQRNFARSTDDTLQGVGETLDERLAPLDPADVAAHRTVVAELTSAALFIELADLDGRVTVQSPNTGLRPLPTFVTSRVLDNPGFHTATYRNAKVRLVRYPLHRSGSVAAYAIVATPIETVDDSLTDLAIAVVAAGVIGLVLAVAGTLWVSQRETWSLRELAEAARVTAQSGFETPLPPSAGGSQETRDLRGALTELVARQQEVMHREREFFADSSHVLRTPLAVLQGELEILDQGVYGREREEVMAQARASVEALSRAVSGLLLLAREHESGVDPSWEVVDVRSIVEPVAAAAGVAAPGVHVTATASDGLDVAGDAHQLRDLFMSVIENACRYTPAGGDITIDAHADARGENVIVEVRDTGIGFAPADLARATERFYRGAGARRVFPAGSGLGLAIASRIARLHHGSITVGNNDGRGARVVITLPLVG